MRSLCALLWIVGFGLLAASTPDGEAADSPQLSPGAIELGISGALDVVEGNTRAGVSVLGSTFRPLAGGLVGFGIDVGYSHVSSRELLDLEGHITWQHVVSGSSLYPFAGFGGGLRQEWLGSFRTTRYPVGIDLGLRALVSEGAAIRFEYRLRQVLNDPVSDFTEHRLLVGVSLLFRNQQTH